MDKDYEFWDWSKNNDCLLYTSTDTYRETERQLGLYLLIYLAVSAAAAVCVAMMVKRLLKPLKELEQAAGQLSGGNLKERVEVDVYKRQVMNLVMVLMNLKFFKRSRFLNGVLTVICGCTYVMIASAAYRMALYVGAYHLTYLRILVLWFLLLLACMMAGVVILIYRNRFPLFGWCLVMVSVFFVGFSYMRPDRVIADYNAAHVGEWSDSDFTYMTQALSADAVPAVLEALEDHAVLGRFYSGGRTEFLTEYYRWVISKNYQVCLLYTSICFTSAFPMDRGGGGCTGGTR